MTRLAHNQEEAGAIPAPATNSQNSPSRRFIAAAPANFYEQFAQAWEAFGRQLRGHHGIKDFVEARAAACRRQALKVKCARSGGRSGNSGETPEAHFLRGGVA